MCVVYDTMDIGGSLKEIFGEKRVLKNEPMKNHTSFKIGGAASFVVLPENENEIILAVKCAKKFNYPVFVIGNGSNLLVDDKGLFGVVIKLGSNFSNIFTDGNIITAYSGALLSVIAQEALKNSLCGFEFASGIPGTLGGAVKMNAGAYGGEIKDVVIKTLYLDKNLNLREKIGGEHMFAYRSSGFSDDDIIIKSQIRLEKGNADDIKAKMLDLNSRRRLKQPLKYPSAGSTFKRPEGHFAAQLIEKCGLKGAKIGGACVSQKHSGFIINYDNASFSDVINLINYVKKTVFEKTGVTLCEEVKILSNIQ